VAPRLQAFLALLTGRFRLSRRSVQELLATVFAEELALGTISTLEGRTAAALSAPYEAAQQYVATAPSVNSDETPWLHGDRRAWMWTAVTPAVVCYRIDPSRSRAALERLLPPLGEGEERTVTSDRYSVYTHLVGEAWQICWAHLVRDFTALAQMKEATPRGIGETALAQIERLFAVWHAYRRGELDRAGLAAGMQPVQEAFEEILKQAEGSGHWKAAPLGWHLLGHFASLWTFVGKEGVEPTNNAAERAVRPAVLMRKSSFGTRSERGRGFVERMLTVVGSLKAQGEEVMAYLEAAIRAAAKGADAPSLVPTASS
jgi:transposase